MTALTFERILTPAIFLAIIALCVAGCSREPAWQHRTLRGIDADVQRDRDVKYCEDQMPHELPTAIYVDTWSLNTYESQDGRATGSTKGKSAGARRGTLEAVHSGGDGEVSSSKIDAAQRRTVFNQCMTQRGWTVKGRKDKERGTTPATPAGESSQPGAPGTL